MFFTGEVGAGFSLCSKEFSPDGNSGSGSGVGAEDIGSLYHLLPQSSPSLPAPARDHLRAFLRLHPREKAVTFMPLAFVPFTQHCAGNSME